MNLRKINDEVFIAQDPIARMGPTEVEFLKTQATVNERHRARICAHKSNDDSLHEMIIGISSRSYIHPHKHLGKSESFHIVEGSVDVVIFDESGQITDLIELGDHTTRRLFFYRLAQPAFHTLLLNTDFLVVHEVTGGPFLRENTMLAPWAPVEQNIAAAVDYIDGVRQAAKNHRRRAAVA